MTVCFESRHHSEQVFPIYPGSVPDSEFGKREKDSLRSLNQTPQTLLSWSNSSFSLGLCFLSCLVAVCVIRIGRSKWSFEVKTITSDSLYYCLLHSEDLERAERPGWVSAEVVTRCCSCSGESVCPAFTPTQSLLQPTTGTHPLLFSIPTTSG